jgi:hypothetical protein
VDDSDQPEEESRDKTYAREYGPVGIDDTSNGSKNTAGE